MRNLLCSFQDALFLFLITVWRFIAAPVRLKFVSLDFGNYGSSFVYLFFVAPPPGTVICVHCCGRKILCADKSSLVELVARSKCYRVYSFSARALFVTIIDDFRRFQEKCLASIHSMVSIFEYETQNFRCEFSVQKCRQQIRIENFVIWNF
jgi:hypothetical protein